MPDSGRSLRDLELMFEEYGERWKNFGRRICQNEYVYTHLLKLQRGRCNHCHRDMHSEGHLHHMDYINLCRSDAVPPDCETCHHEAPQAFRACVMRLELLHAKCHMATHGIRRRKKIKQK